MPLYDYECECGEKKEKFVKSQEEVVECPECGKDMKKVLSANYKIRMPGYKNRKAGQRYV